MTAVTNSTYLRGLKPHITGIEVLNPTITTANIGDHVQLLTIPTGMTITSITFVYAAGGTSATGSLGDGGSSTRYTSSLDISGAGVTVVSSGLGHKYTGVDTLTLTVGGAVVTALAITVIVTYLMDYN